MNQETAFNTENEEVTATETAVEDEIVEDEIVEDEIVENEIVENEAVEAETVEDEIVEDETVENEASEENEAPQERIRTPEEVVAALEALLFSTGEAVSADRLMNALNIKRDVFDEAMTELMDRFDTDDHGITVIRLEDSYQMCTKESFYDDLIALEVAPTKPTLTDSALETLSIIAYKQPVTRAEVERIRGVNSDRLINKLVEYDLVRELGRLNAPGRPILFGTTESFLRCFGVSSAEDLPPIDTTRIEEFKAEAEEEAKARVEVTT